MKKSIDLLRAAGIVCCVLFALISFLPCFQESWIYNDDVVTSGFAPGFSVVVSALEITFLLCKRRGFRIAGAVLSILKVGVLISVSFFLPSILDGIGINPSYTTILPATYVLIVIGIVSIVLYILSFLAGKAPSRSPEPRIQERSTYDFDFPGK